LGQTTTTEGLGDLYGVLAWIFMAAMAVTAFEPIRRHYFELFYYTHSILLYLVVIFAMMHSKTAFWLGIGPAALYMLDRVFRFVRSHRHVKVLSVSAKTSSGGERVTILECQIPGFKYHGGDYCFISIPAIEILGPFTPQWHPFSISAFPNQPGDPFTFHIMDMGVGSFTHKVAEHADDIAKGKMPVYVDGPYGSLSLDLLDYPSVVLCCGGVGATPMVSIFGDLYVRYLQGRLKHIREVRLLWVSGTEGPLLDWFRPLLGEIQHWQNSLPEKDRKFFIHLFASGSLRGKHGGAHQAASGMDLKAVAPPGATSASEPVQIKVTEKKDEGNLPATEGKQELLPSAQAMPSDAGAATPLSGQQEKDADITTPLLHPLSPRLGHGRFFAVTPVTQGRPNFDKEFDAINGKGDDVAVLCCGPVAMMAHVQRAAIKRNMHMHRETFFL